MRIAERVKRALVDERHGVAAAHELHGFANALAQVPRALSEVPDELGSDLGIGIGKEGNAQLNELTTQLVGVDECAVMGERDDNLVDGGEVRLRGLPAFGARRSVAHVPHRELARKRRKVGVGKDLPTKAQVFTNHDGAAVANRDTSGFLSSMLKRAQTEIRQARDIALGSPNAEYTALLVQLIVTVAISCLRLHTSRSAHLRRPDGFLRHDIPS